MIETQLLSASTMVKAGCERLYISKMRPQLFLALAATLQCIVAQPADVEERAVTTSKKSTTTTSSKTTSTTARTTSTSSSTTALTSSTSAAALTTGTVPTTLATTLNAQQSASVQAASAQIAQAQKQPQCSVSGGRILSAYYQTNQSSFSVPAQISVLQSKIPGNNTYYDRTCIANNDMCAVNGFRFPVDKSFSSSTKIQDNNFKGCQKLCKAASGCTAFSVKVGLGGACQLYKRPLYQDFVPDATKFDIFWDINCPANVPGALNAPPSLTPYVPSTPIPSISNSTQGTTFAAFITPTPLSTNDPAYTPTGSISTPDDDNIFVQTYTYDQYSLPPVSVTGSPPITTGLAQPTDIPSAPCMVSTGPQATFTVINEQYLPMVSRTGSIGPILQPTVAPAAGDPILSPDTLVLPPFYFQAVSGSSNVYDLVYAGSSGPQYVAMHSNGSVLLASASTGTSFANNLVTSIFSFDCLGTISMTQGGSSYNWVTTGAVSSFVKGTQQKNMKALPVNMPAVVNARKNRRENMQMAERIRKRSYTDGPAPKCPASPAGLVPYTKQGYEQGKGNFCDALDDWWGLSPYDFDGSCAVQSYCYDSCHDYTWVGCNAVFGTMMIASCWGEFDSWWDIASAIACTVQASYFTGVAATSRGRELFYDAQKAMCRCFCTSPPDTCAYSDTNFYCADLHHGKDDNNCGACGQIYGPKSKCRDGGFCGCPQDQCGSTCLDFRNNPNNCGSCGNVCSSGYCVGGSCYTPKPGECTPDQGISQDFSDYNFAAYPGCTLGSNVNFGPATYTGANGQSISAISVEMTNLPGSGCQGAVTAINAKMCAAFNYELTFTMGAVGQVNGQNVNSNAQCTVYWATGPPGSPGNNGNYQSSPSFSIQTNSNTFKTFGPWGPIHVKQGDPGVEMHHGNLYVQMTAVISCKSTGGDGYFALGDIELNQVGTASKKARGEAIDPAAKAEVVILTRDGSGFNITQALDKPYTPPDGDKVLVLAPPGNSSSARRRNGTHPVHNVDNQDEKQQIMVASIRKAQMAKPLLQSTLPASDALDAQLFADFYETYLPANVFPWREITYLRIVAETVPETMLLKLAKRTMGLAHVGALSRNERIQQESRIAYGRLLGMLHASIRSSAAGKDAGSNIRGILSTMALMTHVNDHVRALSDDDETDDSWVLHLETAQHLLVLQGPRHLDADQSLDKGLIRHICYNSFFLAVAKRKAWRMNPSWLQMASKGLSELLKVFGGLPTILQNVDRALASGDSVTKLLDHVSRLFFIATHAQGLFPELQEPPSVGVIKAQRSRPKIEELKAMASSSVFPQLYSPMSEVAAQRLVCLTILVLVVQCTILRIWSLCPETIMLVPDEMRQNIEKDADRLARRLCKLVLSLTQPDRLVPALIVRLGLTLAYNVFEQQKADAEMGWCHDCLVANQARLDRLFRSNNHHTLCKVRAVIPGIAEAGRYGDVFDPRAFVVRDDRDTGEDIFQDRRCPVASRGQV
ncbi:hypothetical protein PRZ48_002726 [Zasmidium cellare]|uniref:Apple domain-containing protein n=1 Tax=Zasmidium cellare TaxID=395010 RepID=A0ABR0ETN7_ZASCE|nr:hypothetical protein PRZ48_002726 [Zasmidium cellare]